MAAFGPGTSEESLSASRTLDRRIKWRQLVPVLGVLAVVAVSTSCVMYMLPPMPAGCEDTGIKSLVHGMLGQFTGSSGSLHNAVLSMHACYEQYSQAHPYALPITFVITYLGMQSVSIPGTLWLSVLCGAVFPPLQAQLIIAFSATVGSCIAFLMVQNLARPIVSACIPRVVASVRAGVESNREHLQWYMLFLRITPLFPNWAVTLCSPIVGVPLRVFFIATAVGLVPANYMHVQVGATLARLGKDFSLDAIKQDPSVIVALFLLQFVALAPVAYKRLTGRSLKGEGSNAQQPQTANEAQAAPPGKGVPRGAGMTTEQQQALGGLTKHASAEQLGTVTREVAGTPLRRSARLRSA